MPDVITHGLAALDAMFARAKAEGRSAFLPYFPIGYPSYEESLDIIESMAAAGVDGFEIGIPFSDPLADGPVIQAATQKALEGGATLHKCLEGIRELRARGVDQPMLLMGYMNPFLRYGIDQFAKDAADAGADGVIVPDLPPEEAERIGAACHDHGLALVFLLAPTSSKERIALVAQKARGFIYVVSLTGITGERQALASNLEAFVGRVRAQAGDTPLVLGFGISTPAHVALVSKLVDGYIVGSALVRAGGEGIAAARALTEQLMPR